MEAALVGILPPHPFEYASGHKFLIEFEPPISSAIRWSISYLPGMGVTQESCSRTLRQRRDRRRLGEPEHRVDRHERPWSPLVRSGPARGLPLLGTPSWGVWAAAMW